GQKLRNIQSRQLRAGGNHGLVARELRALARVQREGLIAVSEQVTACQVESVAETVIDLHHEIVAVDDIGNAVSVIGPGAWNVLLRVEAKNLCAQRVFRSAGGRVRSASGGYVGGAGYGNRQRRTGPSA